MGRFGCAAQITGAFEFLDLLHPALGAVDFFAKLVVCGAGRVFLTRLELGIGRETWEFWFFRLLELARRLSGSLAWALRRVRVRRTAAQDHHDEPGDQQRASAPGSLSSWSFCLTRLS